MMLVGELGAKLSLYGKQQFDSDLASSGKQFLTLGDIGNKVGSGIASTVKFAASATTVLASAAAAVGVNVLKTGLAYNTLQQTSRAALRTLVGGAEQANDQMDKLDAFARTSPFSKSVFLSAQQQLLGFGVEAKKVIPILDSVQNATAAVGGSNEDIEGLVAIFAKIQSSAKITAEDLNMFGGRGVDAAGLIGLALGKTGQQIREEITAGTLAADVAIDALTQGMQAKFGGASANVKQTISGTVDRIKAASREIGAAMAEPFVSQQGGGLFVTWGNQVADVLQAVRSKTAPIVQIVTTQLQPAFIRITDTLDAIRVHVKAFNVDNVSDGLRRVSDYAPAIAGLGAAWATVGLRGLPVIGGLVAGMNPLVAGMLAVAAASPELRDSAQEALTALEPLVPVVIDLAKTGLSALNIVLPVAAEGITTVAHAVTPLLKLAAALPAPLIAGVAGFVALKNAVGSPLATALKTIGERMALQAALGGEMAVSYQVAGNAAETVGKKTSLMGSLMGVAGTAASGLGNSLKAAFITNPVGLIVLALSAVVGGLASAFANAAEKAAEQKQRIGSLRETLVLATGAYTDLTEAAVRKNLEDKGAVDAAQKLGISTITLIDAIMGNAEALAIVNAATGEYSNKVGAKYKLQMEEIAASRLIEEVIGNEKTALEGAAEATRRDAEEKRAATSGMDDFTRSNNRLNEAIAIARDTSKDATTRLNALKQALDELKGGAISAEEAEKRLSETNLSLAEGLAQANEAGTSLWATTVDGAGKIDITSRAGLSFADSMGRSRDAMLLATQAAYDQIAATGDIPGAVAAAQAAGEGYIGTLRGTMQQAGLTDEQINGLIGTYLDVPSVVATFVTDNQTIDQVDQSLIMLTKQILSTPDKTVTITEPLSPEVIRGLQNLNYNVEHLKNGEVKITSTGAQSVEDTLNYITRSRTVAVTTSFNGGNVPFANGGHVAYANGGTVSHSVSRPIQEFRNGGFPSGIYAGGRPIYKFAEEGVPWETFLSGKPSAKTRNQYLTVQTAKRLDMSMDDFSSLGAKAFANGGNEVYRQARSGISGTARQSSAAPAVVREGDTLNATFQLAPVAGRPLTDQLREAVQRLKIRRMKK